MSFHYSKHVLEELEKRRLSRSLLEEVLHAPEQKVSALDNITCYQSRVEIGGIEVSLTGDGQRYGESTCRGDGLPH